MSNSRGAALWETLPVLSLLIVLVSGTLIASYLAMGRVWLHYQAEQALYCLHEGRTVASCQKSFLDRAQTYLPWGRVKVRLAHGRYAEIQTMWIIQSHFEIRLLRQLDLRSSALSRSSPLWSR